MTHLARRGGRLRRSPQVKSQLCAILAVASVLFWPLTPPANARVDPLVVIERQIRKANMLIVLDTSGSMNGVPGGQFQNSTECGVDCDNGVNCRQGGVLGICSVWRRTCLSNDDCRHGYCSKDNITICDGDEDCPSDPGTCTITGGTCTLDSQCPSQNGVCSASGVACSSSEPCASVGKCKYGTNVICTNPGGYCPTIGTCSTSSTQTCQDSSTCPPATSGGTCSATPQRSCNQDTDCTPTKHCQYSGEPCRNNGQCTAYTTNICDGGWLNGHWMDGYSCTSDANCGWNGSCIPPPANTCMGTPNVCVLPPGVCNMHTDNRCTATTNTCSAPSNTCNIPTPNSCQTPASSTDTCVPSPSGTPGPIRMCKGSQIVCARDSDCGTGDLCGPATSRTVIAKRAISKVVMDNYSLVNFGLMTFYQDGYFPYYQMTSGSSNDTITVFESEEQLRRAGCYSWNRHTHRGGPTATCTISGRLMTLRATGDSRYRVHSGRNDWNRYDVNFCGDSCDMPNHLGMGKFLGSYYEYQRYTQTQTQTMVERSTYDGHDITVNGINYSYYKPLSNYYNGGHAPPIAVANCGSYCSATCGGRWDSQLAPFIDTTDNPANALAAAQAITARMDYASDGGLITYWGTPTGCTLQNSVATSPFASAYHYMSAVKNGYSSTNPSLHVAADPISCRNNFVLLVTDGAANGPGDVDSYGNSICDDNACADADPVTAGCHCRSVLAAYHLYHDLGVMVFVVGFSGDVRAGPPAVANNNVALAGGSGSAYQATSEDELNRALQMAIYDALKGKYSSSTGSTSAGTQQAVTVIEGRYALDSRMAFPSWQGHLNAYDVSSGQPVPFWDANAALTPPDGNPNWANWKYRRVYTWDGTNMVKIQVDAATGAVTNKDQLAALGMGANSTEAELVARWALGDPTMGNPAVLGAIVNSTPIDVASPGNIPLPGGNAFFLRHRFRPHLVYVGSSDQMLHAFFLENTAVGSTTYAAGTEAFAFIPPDLLPNLRKLYAQGGQDLNPYKHVFGLADSPKAKSLCVSGCTDDATAIWKTLLLMPEGYGGSNTFMLDISNPFGANGLNDPPISVEWHTGYGSSASSYADVLGNTISLPAYFFNKTTGLNDYRLIFSSGYAVTEGNSSQGRTLVTASAVDGRLLTTDSVSAANTCAQEYSALTDVGTARDFARGQNDRLVAGYFGDTSGQLWRYTLAGGLTAAYDFTCDHPLHFSPTVVQLDRDNYYSSHAHEIYLVQVTNSNLDLDTAGFPASQLIVAKEIATADAQGGIADVATDTTWGTGGKIVLTVGTDKICGKTREVGGTVVCDTVVPANARPTSTPTGLLKADGNGFQVVTMWYAPPSDVCKVGQTFLTIHQMANDQVTQRLGYQINSKNPATSPVIINGRIYVFGGEGAFDDVTPSLLDSITPGKAMEPTTRSGNFTRFNWTEVLD